MKLTKCVNGHFYDADKFSECPHCGSTVVDELAFNYQKEGHPLLENQTDNYITGLKLFEERKYDKAVELLGEVVWSYTAGDQMRQDAFRLLKSMADSGNTLAQCKCGSIYSEGGRGTAKPEIYSNGFRFHAMLEGFQVVERDYKIATYYYDEAIKGGSAEAAFAAYYMYSPLLDFSHASWKDQRKSLQYFVKYIRLELQKHKDDDMKTHCCDDEKINKLINEFKWRIKKLKDIYSDETVDVLSETVDAVERNMPITSQEDVDVMLHAIEDAVDALERKPDADYTVLKETMLKIPSDLSGFTNRTVEILNESINAIDWNLTIARQKDVDEMTVAIETAIAGLESKHVDNIDEDSV